MRVLLSIGAIGLVAWVAVAAAAAPSSTRVVPCSDIILGARTGHDGGYRVVLGAVSVPPAYRPQVVPTGLQRWRFSSKVGLVIRAGRGVVSVSVPRVWRKRAAITWGNSTGIVSSLRIARCSVREPGKPWNAYAGGFYLRSRAACVPLVFSIGQQRTTVRFGVGRRCGGA